MKENLVHLNEKGFTMIEVVAVMVIMSVMVSVGVKKLDLLSHTASDRVLEQALRELNTRETLVWTQIKISDRWIDDANLFLEIDTSLGDEFVWTEGPDTDGGTLSFKTKSIQLNRIASSSLSVGRWN